VRITIAQVAALAAVSTATASRALNRPSTVSESLRDRVSAAVGRLGYVPNQTARALSSLHSGLVGVLVPAYGMDHVDMLEGMQTRLNATRYDALIVTTGGDGDRALAAARAMAAREVEGLIAIDTALDSPLSELLDGRRIPYVRVDADPGSPTQWGVDIGYTAGGEIVGAYLAGLGHRSLAFLGRPARGLGRRAGLLRGLRAALTASAASLPLERTLACTALDIRAALQQWFREAAPPTALVCADDVLALAALRESALLGIKVPGQLSVVGCGDLPFARQASPALSTLRIPGMTIGAAAVDQLARRWAGAPPTGQSIPIKLVIRQSSGAAPA
jgi:LacI family transcriptional regulator